VGSDAPESALIRTPRREERPELFAAAAEKLGLIERINIHLVRSTFTVPAIDRAMLFLARSVGALWVHHCTKHIREIHGLERLPPSDPHRSFILVSNHRGFFDMFVINMALYRYGWRHRLLFPVRSNFFYDHPLGLFVNAAMSFLSMYPPIFRDRKKAVLNHTAFNELIWAMKRGRSAGIHPEGTRNKGDDPYTFLPAQSGVGRAIYKSRVMIIPAFINGLSNDIVRQVAGNFNGKGKKVIVVFGKPLDFGPMLDEPPTARLFKQIADKTLEEIGKLGQEEKAIREASAKTA
jgi:1-acyl-sn-glycerol-3-phosphate acyltransferase